MRLFHTFCTAFPHGVRRGASYNQSKPMHRGMLFMTCCFSLSAQQFDLQATLRRLENRYNNIKTLQLDFEQTFWFTTQPTARRTESGILFLRKPGRMRWEYREPARKLFLSDGKNVFFYSPSANRVERSKLKETGDIRAPLAFLIGRLDFQRDFREYRTRTEPSGRWIQALPKSDKAPYREVEFLLLDNAQITRLKVVGQDQSVMEFVFRNERLNPPVDDKLFQFEAPAGAEIVDVGN